MEIIKIQEAELMQAREIQKQCVNLHLPSPPVISWIATLIDEEGNETQKTIAKANSYVRNAYNTLARHLGFASPEMSNTAIFADGSLNTKQTNGTLSNGFAANLLICIGLGDNTNPIPEDINYSSIIVNQGVWGSVNGTTQRFSDFDPITRKLITQITVTYNNPSTSSQAITESCLYIGQSNPHQALTGTLMIRDVFAPINVPPGMSIRFTYQTEVLFPL